MLDQRGRTPPLTLEQQLNLSEYLIRLGKPAEAMNLLTPLAAQDRGNFFILLNLAMASFLSGQMQRGIDYQEQALAAWPMKIEELTPQQRRDMADLLEARIKRLK